MTAVEQLIPPTHRYEDAGVDTERAEEGLRRLTALVEQTWPEKDTFGKVQLKLGYFANVINFGSVGLALCTDGVGTKAIVAQMMHKYDTIGIDCIAMNVNDLVCVGATPRSFVDYIAIERANAEVIDALAVGLVRGAKDAGVSISGGEIAQLRDIIRGYNDTGFDIVGMAVGDVPLDKVIVGQGITPGDIIIGLESNGIHSNGLSLARRAFFDLHDYSLDHRFEELEGTVGEELLKPTYIYVREILEVLREVPKVKALIHITSDGLMNLNRVAAKSIGYVIDSLPPIPPIFSLIQGHANVSTAEMFEVYNMGIGFCIVVSPDSEELVFDIMKRNNRKAHAIGHVVKDEEERVFLPKEGLYGKNKHFFSQAECSD